MNVTLETINLPETGQLDIELRITANLTITPQQATRLVSVFAGNEIADLLHGGSPTLVVRAEGTYWRVPVILSTKSFGPIGSVGAIDVHVETGNLRLTEQIISEIETNAQRLAIGTAL